MTPQEQIDFVVGPQVAIGTDYFSRIQVERGKFHGRNFPATPPTGEALDPYLMMHYYDLGKGEYVAHRRTADPEFLSLARKVEDSFWLTPWIDEGRQRDFDGNKHLSPKFMGLAGLTCRAIDDRPEMWDWINAYTRHQFNNWLKIRISDSALYLGVREGAFILHAATWLARLLPDSFPLQSGGMETNGAALRAQYLADVEREAEYRPVRFRQQRLVFRRATRG